MKKIFTAVVCGVLLLITSTSAFAANNVSDMATAKGGQSVAECAQMMDKGISECVTMAECEAGM